MTIIHILTIMIGGALVYGAASGEIKGGAIDTQTGLDVSPNWLPLIPLVIGLIIASSGIGGIIG